MKTTKKPIESIQKPESDYTDTLLEMVWRKQSEIDELKLQKSEADIEADIEAIMEELYHDFYEADMDKIRKIIEKHLTPKKPETFTEAMMEYDEKIRKFKSDILFKKWYIKLDWKLYKEVIDEPEMVDIDDEEAILNSEEEWRNEDWSPYDKDPQAPSPVLEVEINKSKSIWQDEMWCYWYRCTCGSTEIANWFNYCPWCWVKIVWLD